MRATRALDSPSCGLRIAVYGLGWYAFGCSVPLSIFLSLSLSDMNSLITEALLGDFTVRGCPKLAEGVTPLIEAAQSWQTAEEERRPWSKGTSVVCGKSQQPQNVR